MKACLYLVKAKLVSRVRNPILGSVSYTVFMDLAISDREKDLILAIPILLLPLLPTPTLMVLSLPVDYNSLVERPLILVLNIEVYKMAILLKL